MAMSPDMMTACAIIPRTESKTKPPPPGKLASGVGFGEFPTKHALPVCGRNAGLGLSRSPKWKPLIFAYGRQARGLLKASQPVVLVGCGRPQSLASAKMDPN
jgi:hypothetical protein